MPSACCFSQSMYTHNAFYLRLHTLRYRLGTCEVHSCWQNAKANFTIRSLTVLAAYCVGRLPSLRNRVHLVYQGTLTWNSLPESMRIVSSLDAFKRSCIISFTPSSLLHLPLLSLVHMYSFTYFLYVFYMCTGMCINGHVYFISLFIYLLFYLFFFALVCVLHVYMYV